MVTLASLVMRPNDYLCVYDGHVKSNRSKIEQTLTKTFGVQRWKKTEGLTLISNVAAVRRERPRTQFSATNVEVVFVVPPSCQKAVVDVGKIIGKRSGGTCAMLNQDLPLPKDCPQVTATEKAEWLGWIQTTINCNSVAVNCNDPKSLDKAKQHMGKFNRGFLPMSWFDRSADHYAQLFKQLGVTEIHDLTAATGSSAHGLLKLMSEQKVENQKPMRWMGMCHSIGHASWVMKNVSACLQNYMLDSNSFHYEPFKDYDDIKKKYPDLFQCKPQAVIELHSGTDSSAGECGSDDVECAAGRA